MTGEPAISVIMPTFNVGPYVDAAVASILAQTIGDFEFLVFDDGSTDDTLARLHAWREKDPRVIVGGGEHRGYCPWLNAGIAQARGRWLARMDADDIAQPDRFARQLVWFETHPNGVAVGGGFEVIDEEGAPIYVHLPATDHAAIVSGLYGGYGSQLCHPAVMMARDAVRRVGSYRVELESAEDVDLFIRLAEIGELGAVPLVLLRYRWHLRSVSHERRLRQQQAVNQILSAAWQRRGEPMPSLVRGRLDELTARSHAPTTARELQEKIIWLARNHGNLRTARKHAGRLLRQRWWERRSWKMWLECWRKVAPPTTN